jgi:exopolysaccharide biosynthesis protein
MRPLFAAVFGMLALAASARADWRASLVEERPGPVEGTRFVRLRFTDEKTDPTSFTANALVMNASEVSAQIVDQPEASRLKAPSLATIVKQEKAFAGINGGYFTRDFKPVGLHIDHGKMLSPVSKVGVASGAVFIDSAGRLALRSRKTDLSQAEYAIQAGPFLIDPGGKLGIGKQGPAEPRTVLAASDDDIIVAMATSPVSLRDLAQCLLETASSFGVQRFERALNMDGGSSTGLFVNFKKDPFQWEPLGPVRNIIVFKR